MNKMPHPLLTNITRFNELDAGRLRGEVIKLRVNMKTENMDALDPVESYPGCTEDFYAAAPSMVSTLNTALDIIRKQREALEIALEKTPKQLSKQDGFFTSFKPNPVYVAIQEALSLCDLGEG